VANRGGGAALARGACAAHSGARGRRGATEAASSPLRAPHSSARAAPKGRELGAPEGRPGWSARPSASSPRRGRAPLPRPHARLRERRGWGCPGSAIIETVIARPAPSFVRITITTHWRLEARRGVPLMRSSPILRPGPARTRGGQARSCSSEPEGRHAGASRFTTSHPALDRPQRWQSFRPPRGRHPPTGRGLEEVRLVLHRRDSRATLVSGGRCGGGGRRARDGPLGRSARPDRHRRRMASRTFCGQVVGWRGLRVSRSFNREYRAHGRLRPPPHRLQLPRRSGLGLLAKLRERR